MNRDLKYRVYVMQAALDGKAIQFSCNNGAEWDDAIDPKNTSAFAWNWDSFDYRIAPEPHKPREWWLTPATATCSTLFASEFMPHASCNPIHVREVLPE